MCRSPSFAILVNGSSMSWFHSTIGLRQGDPLSPYLFVLGSEVLTRIIKREQTRGLLTRLPLDTGYEHVGHLLYVALKRGSHLLTGLPLELGFSSVGCNLRGKWGFLRTVGCWL